MSETANWSDKVYDKVNDLLHFFKKREEEINRKGERLESDRVAFEQEMKSKREEQEKEINKQLNELEESRKSLEEEKKRMEKVHEFQSSPVHLNVGGQRFTTSLQTLRRESYSMLGTMFSGRHKLLQDADGSYFVDRDGTHFRHVLNYLRDGFRAEMLPQDEVCLREIQNEADYYQLEGLVAGIESILNPPPPALDFTQNEINAMLATLTRQTTNNDSIGVGPFNRSSSADFVFHNMTKTDLDFGEKNLSGLTFAHTTFAHNVSFAGARLLDTCFYGCEFVSHVIVDFSDADISGADFRHCRCVQGGPNPFGGLGSTSLGTGGGFMFGSSCSSFAHLINTGHVKFTGAKHAGTRFDPNILEIIRF